MKTVSQKGKGYCSSYDFNSRNTLGGGPSMNRSVSTIGNSVSPFFFKTFQRERVKWPNLVQTFTVK